uniref:Putative secreted protein n=1 Tax=Anopheles darlingi TaxID=43151 RepID=A0A2M4DKD3_ANODA
MYAFDTPLVVPLKLFVRHSTLAVWLMSNCSSPLLRHADGAVVGVNCANRELLRVEPFSLNTLSLIGTSTVTPFAASCSFRSILLSFTGGIRFSCSIRLLLLKWF